MRFLVVLLSIIFILAIPVTGFAGVIIKSDLPPVVIESTGSHPTDVPTHFEALDEEFGMIANPVTTMTTSSQAVGFPAFTSFANPRQLESVHELCGWQFAPDAPTRKIPKVPIRH